MTVDTAHFSLTPRDPLIARDGRPFGAGLRMKSLHWFYPSVMAGASRTLIGQAQGGFPDARSQKTDYDKLTARLKRLGVAGPFPQVGGELYFPAPQDIIVRKTRVDGRSRFDALAVRPLNIATKFPGAGCNLPDGLSPALLLNYEDFKPERPPSFWSQQRMAEWLVNPDGATPWHSFDENWPSGFLSGPKHDLRTHVQVDFASGASRDGMLFQTEGLALDRLPRPNESAQGDAPDQLAVRLQNTEAFRDTLQTLGLWFPFGGERRLVRWDLDKNAAKRWACPEQVRTVLKDATLVRMVLATPAIFGGGWKPAWLEPRGVPTRLEGTVPGTSVRVRLISACFERWQPLSGWGYEPYGTDRNGKLLFGPKAVRRMVPAGGVYFFKVIEGAAQELAGRWLEPVCHADTGHQDHLDGFGLALWGVWTPLDTNSVF